MKLILASTSESRKKIVSKLMIPFHCISPECDETPQENECAEKLVQRLSYEKAQSVAKNNPNAITIGSDQVGVLDGKIIGKPLTESKAKEQLCSASGKQFVFFTGLSVIVPSLNFNLTTYETFTVTFRHLSDTEIDHYVKKEKPLCCAGSFKCDELGITLFDKLEGNDINTLIGLPLIKLNKMLIDIGYNFLTTEFD